MPRKNKSKKGKKANKKGVTSSSNVPSTNTLSRSLGGVTQSLRRTLNWVYIAVNAVGIGYTEQLVCKLNSPYDPDQAIGGASDVGFAKYMTFYSKCFCLGARIKVKGSFDYTGDVQVQYESVIHGVTITTYTASIGSTVAAINVGLVDYGLTSASPSRFEHSMGVDIGKFLHKPKVLDDPQLYCTAGADPTQLVVAHVWTDNRGSGHTNGTFVYEVEMDCIFTDPIPFT
jgi:hypothetical protein